MRRVAWLMAGRLAIGWFAIRRTRVRRFVLGRLVVGWLVFGWFGAGWFGFGTARRLVVMPVFWILVPACIFTVIARVIGNSMTEVARGVARVRGRGNDRLGWDRRIDRCTRIRDGAGIERAGIARRA